MSLALVVLAGAALCACAQDSNAPSSPPTPRPSEENSWAANEAAERDSAEVAAEAAGAASQAGIDTTQPSELTDAADHSSEVATPASQPSLPNQGEPMGTPDKLQPAVTGSDGGTNIESGRDSTQSKPLEQPGHNVGWAQNPLHLPSPNQQAVSGPSLEVVTTPEARIIEPPRWRTSVRSRSCPDCGVVTQVEGRKNYVLSIRLSNDELDVAGGAISQVMSQVAAEISEVEATTFRLVPLFVDGLMPFSEVDARPAVLVVNRLDEPGLWGQAELEFAVLPNAKKCASLIVSIWDATLTQAYDAFLVTLPIGRRGAASRCPNPLRPATLLTGPSLVSVSDAFQPPVPSTEKELYDRVSLYAFELPIKHSSYVFAAISPLHGETTVSGWKLKTPLSESFGLQAADFNMAAQRDRERMNGASETEWIYEKTAKFIKKKLFTAETTSGGANPNGVFEQLRTVINRDGANAKVMAQIFVPILGSDENGLMFLPLRTLAGDNSAYFKDFDFASPLPGDAKDEGEADTCVSSWRLVLNTSLAGGAGEDADAKSNAQAAIERLAALEPKPWRAATMTSNETIRDFFENQDDAPDQAGSTGIIIAAHYGRRSLGLEGDEISVEDLTAYRAANSVAVLAACETAAPTEANGIIRGLRGQNVDTFLASPLRVPTDYAIRFVDSLVRQIDLAYANGEQPTLEMLYQSAMDNVETHSEGQRVEARSLGREFVIVGDATRRLCKFPQTEVGEHEQD